MSINDVFENYSCLDMLDDWLEYYRKLNQEVSFSRIMEVISEEFYRSKLCIVVTTASLENQEFKAELRVEPKRWRCFN